MKQIGKKGFLLAVLTLLMIVFSIVAGAAEGIDQMPDLESGRKGTLSVTLSGKDRNGQLVKVEGVKLGVYRVADLAVVNGGSATYTLTSDFAESAVEFDGMSTSESVDAAAELKAIVNNKKLSGRTAVTDQNGTVKFESLDPAMYLVMQIVEKGVELKYTEMEPYLVSVPLGENENGQASWTYDVESVPKMIVGDTTELGRITVTKRVSIYLDGEIALLPGMDAVYYFGIFEDAEGTKPFQNYPVQEARLKDSTYGIAEFTNLPKGTYYIFEVSENGTVIRPGDRVIDAVPPYTCTIEGRKTNAVTIDPEGGVKEANITFNNVFDDLPWGYTFEAQINIAKTVYIGDEQTEVDETFYAGIFTEENGEYYLYHVFELKQNGTVSVPVMLDDNDLKPVTYWIFETDREGNPVNPDELGYEVTGEGSVTMSRDNLIADVEIVNSIPELETEYGPDTETESEITKETEKSTEKAKEPETTKETPSPTPNVQTGDETPVVLYLALAGAALLIIILLLLVRSRKNRS